MRKRIIGKVLSLAMVLSLFGGVNTSKAEEWQDESISYEQQEIASVEDASKAATVPCVSYSGSNIEAQDYISCASPVYSYMTECSNGNYMLVEKIGGSQKIFIQYFDKSYNLLSNRELTFDLPEFGGFYETDSNYYLLTGQENPNKDDTVEVFRITKYDKNWNRISSCGVFGEITCIPFYAGSARMTNIGDFLFVHTCHETYYGEQSNFTIQVNMSTMEVIGTMKSRPAVWIRGEGHVSRSFNQFICADGNYFTCVDHGDAYPRAVVLTEYYGSEHENAFWLNGCDERWILKFKGEFGSYTGMSVGGFEISDSSYIVAGSQDKEKDEPSYNNYDKGRDIVVVTMDKNTGEISVNQITNYKEGVIASTPQLVKTGNSSFMLLWHDGDSLSYVKLDGSGKMLGKIYSSEGNLSDCKPILSGNKIVWYTHDESRTTFYEIDISSMALYKKEVITGHNFQYENEIKNGVVKGKCLKCGETREVSQDDISCMFGTVYGAWSSCDYYCQKIKAGDILYYMVSSEKFELSDIEIISSDENIITAKREKQYFELYGVNSGLALITVRAKDCPLICRQYIVRVGEDGQFNINDVDFPAIPDQAYSGYEIRPANNSCYNEYEATYNGLPLDEEYDYDVSYSNNVEVGEATAIITGKGIFTGEKLIHFNIVCKYHDWRFAGVKEEPTCVKEGSELYTCKICKETKIEKIKALGHSYSSEWDWTIDKKETCTEDGVKSHHCLRCDAVKDETVIPKTGHKWDDGKIIKEPTYESEGVIRYTCLNCESIKDEKIDKIDEPVEDVTAPTSADIYIHEMSKDIIIAGLVTDVDDTSNLEYSWLASPDGGSTWETVSDWRIGHQWLDWTPDKWGDYKIIGKVRVKSDASTTLQATADVSFHPHIKGKCQMPYSGEQGVGYLIGVESYDNPDQKYQYEMLILDCTLLAQGLPAWTYTTGQFRVPEGNAGWCIWTPQYGYYWTLFRVYDENGVLIDEQCYGFANIC